MRTIFCSLFGLALGRCVYLAGSAAAAMPPESQIDYWWIPVCGALFGYGVFISGVLIVVGNGWLRVSSNAQSNCNNSNTKEG